MLGFSVDHVYALLNPSLELIGNDDAAPNTWELLIVGGGTKSIEESKGRATYKFLVITAMLLSAEHRRCSRGVYFVNRSGTIKGYTCNHFNHLMKRANKPKRR